MPKPSKAAYEARIRASKARIDAQARDLAHTARDSAELVRLMRERHNVPLNPDYAETLIRETRNA